jgi:hypothetical protein
MNHKAVVVRIQGGIGNQLFAYAAARRLALINRVELVLDDNSGFKRDFSYERNYQLGHFQLQCRKATFVERLEPFSRIRRKLLLTLNQRRLFKMRSYIKQEIIDFDSRLLDVKIQESIYLEGYWQSEGYFKDVEDVIRDDLSIVPPVDSQNLLVAKRIRSELSVGVHVRFFDSPKQQGINNVPFDYYERAVAKIESSLPGAHYYIFSDQPGAARECVPLPDERVTLVSHNLGDQNAYADLWLMTLCDHFIIANSTFSWWGAWLGGGADKVVIAPGFELREGVAWWGFEGLIPEKWIKM